MKILLLIVAILSFSFSFSQYIPMLEESNSWNVVEIAYFGSGSSNYSYAIDGEVIINGETYKEIIGESCHFREADMIVYGYDINQNAEFVLYDFTLEIGDVVDFINNYHDCRLTTDPFAPEMTLVSKTTQFIAGMDRTVLEFEYFGTWVDTWIEGIGSLTGFYPNGEGMDAGTRLTCFTVDGVTYYFNDFTECIVLGIDDFNKDKIILYPNPVTSRSILELPVEASVDRIRIHDIHGRIVKEEAISKEYYTIDVLDYRSGVYFYQVFSDKAILKTAQFIIK